MYIGENLKRIRKEKGITQTELGARMNVSQQMIEQYENGYIKPKFETVSKIANALDVKIGDLVDELIGEDCTPPEEKLPTDIQKILNRYRELYNEYYDNTKQLSDNVLLMIALDEAIAKIHLERAEERKRGE